MDAIFSKLAGRQAGDLDELFAALHAELRQLARHCLGGQPGQTLTPTVLVNELYLKLSAARSLSLGDQQHFFACAARAMRQIVVDAARASLAGKRGGDRLQVTLTDSAAGTSDADLVALDDAMVSLKAVDPSLHALVEMRFFAGLTMEEIARLRQTSLRSLERDWATARAFLHAQVAQP
ncbi:ECF-type sigma factor [Pseudomarimonas salicorniae]|uniref:ECF-type sigma factor n=1 Tax=Pseudomarimonas salicorniae TaxID=2933270 RepID=A0ABT0GEH7_9GAMM|nr:ECF-type sigma factor [Lysobacter sp. CAU 1642]MCK7592936.1 ECF-type sigma factor [Lysobacter sp. CAU 1642]